MLVRMLNMGDIGISEDPGELKEYDILILNDIPLKTGPVTMKIDDVTFSGFTQMRKDASTFALYYKEWRGA